MLNTLGLSTGVAAALLLFLVVRYELSFDKFHQNHERIYRVILREEYSGGNIDFTPGSALPVAAALKSDIPQFEKIVPVFGTLEPKVTVLGSDSAGTNAPEKYIEKGEGLLVEPGFFDLFNFRWLSGRPEVLAEPNVVVLSRKFAEKYFKDYRQAVGKLLRIDNQTTMRVEGVLEDTPGNTGFPLNLVISYASKRAQPKLFGFGDFNNWNSISSNDQIFVRLPETLSAEKANSLLEEFSRKHYEGRNAQYKRLHMLSPLADMHHDDRLAQFESRTISRERIGNMSIIGVLILLMACINFINIYSALATRRAKEVGVRKVLGSHKLQLVTQFMTETFMVVLVAVGLGAVLARIALPVLERNFELAIDPSFYATPAAVFYLAALVAMLTVLSGVYPALVLSSFSPVEVFRKNLPKGWMRGASFRQVLIAFQFATAFVLAIGTIVNLLQTDYISRLDLGFEKEGVFTLNMDPEYRLQFQSFRNELLRIPGIKAVSFSSDHPSSGNNWGVNFSFTDHTRDEDFEASIKMADGDYFDTYGIRFVAGRAYDVRDTVSSYVVNETLLKKLGIQDPESVIGKDLRLGRREPAPIIGVVRDFHTSSARDATKPVLITGSDRYYWNGGIKIRSQNLLRTVEQVRAVYERIFPEVAFVGNFYDENIDSYYKSERQTGLLYRVFSGLAVFIACLGLLGLTAFTAEARTKEIGVRKVLGASAVNVMALLSRDFLKPVAFAIVIGWPVAWYVMSRWLQDYEYRIDIEWWMFAAAGLGAVAIALLTVCGQAIRAAVANPVEALRNE